MKKFFEDLGKDIVTIWGLMAVIFFLYLCVFTAYTISQNRDYHKAEKILRMKPSQIIETDQTLVMIFPDSSVARVYKVGATRDTFVQGTDGLFIKIPDSRLK